MKVPSKRNKSIDDNSSEDKLLYNMMLTEYNELFQFIYNLSPNEFIENLEKRINLTISKKFNGISKDKVKSLQSHINNKIYSKEYKFILTTMKSIKYNLENNNYPKKFEEKIIEHCKDETKKNGCYIHSCGEPLFTYKYNKSVLQNENESELKDILVICLKCNMVYKSNLIKFRCNKCESDFYSKILNNDNLPNIKNSNKQLSSLFDENLPYATWKKYHCNLIINDTMKCNKCKNNLYFNENKNELICLKCKRILNSNEVHWKCTLCKQEFKSEVKAYNPLEYKNMQIVIKNALINKELAKPECMNCDCIPIDEIKNTQFYHKSTCNGELYLGEMNGKKVVICNKCESLCLYESFCWTCPKCHNKFKSIDINSNMNMGHRGSKNCILSSGNLGVKANKNLSNCRNHILLNKLRSPFLKNNSSHKDKLVNKCDKLLISDKRSPLKDESKENIGAITTSKKNKYQNKEKESNSKIPNSNNKYGNQILFKRYENFNRSPLKLLKKNLAQKFSNADLGEGLKNISSVFDKNNENKLQEKIIESFNNINNGKLCFINLSSNDNKHKEEVNVKINLNYKLDQQMKNEPMLSNDNDNCIKKKEEQIQDNSKKNSLNSNSNNWSMSTDGSNNISDKNSHNSKKSNQSNQSKDKENKNKNRLISIICESDNEDNPPPSLISSKIIKSFDLDEYIVSKEIGSGTYGKIYLAELKSKPSNEQSDSESESEDPNIQYAIKKIVVSSKKEIDSIVHEYEIITSLLNSSNNLNIVKIIGVQAKQFDFATYVIYVLMELAECDWEKEILNRQIRMNYYYEQELLIILSSLINTFSVLQKKNISHRDIKPQNILIMEDRKFKISDFGEAKELMHQRTKRDTDKQTIRGTELYMSPILFHSLKNRNTNIYYVEHNTYKSDVYSLGLCALLAATLNYQSLYEIREIQNMNKVRDIIFKYLGKRYSNRFIGLILRMLEVNEKNRWDFIELESEINKII